MKLRDYTPEDGPRDGIYNAEDQFKDAAGQDEGIENGVYDSEDAGDYEEEEEEEESEEEVIMEVVYAFADYTISDDENSENQVGLYTYILHLSRKDYNQGILSSSCNVSYFYQFQFLYKFSSFILACF